MHERRCGNCRSSGHNRPTCPELVDLQAVLYERFDSRYRLDASGCWIWTGTRGSGGYGVIKQPGSGSPLRLAHRISYERFKGPIPDGLDIDHLCRVRACCNPEHLEAVTRKVNARRGARTVLDEQKVADIRKRMRALADEYGIAVGTLMQVADGRSWSVD